MTTITICATIVIVVAILYWNSRLAHRDEVCKRLNRLDTDIRELHHHVKETRKAIDEKYARFAKMLESLED